MGPCLARLYRLTRRAADRDATVRDRSGLRTPGPARRFAAPASARRSVLPGRVATIQEALAKARQQFHSLVSLPQQQSAGIRSHGSTVELRHYLPAEVSSK